MKIYMAIDRQLIREAQKKNGSFDGLRGTDLFEADALLTDFMLVDYTDADIEEIANLDWDNLQGLGNIFKKIGKAVKKVASVAVNTVKPVVKSVVNVVKSAANVVKTVVTTPFRAVASLGLETLKGPVAKAFTYVFVPDNALELNKFPEVARKRRNQLKAIDLMVKGLSMERSYILKHIRNSIVTHYKKTPEDVLHDFANKRETEFTATQSDLEVGETLEGGMGCVDPATCAAVVASAAGLIGAVAGLAQVFKKPNLPTTNDWVVLADGTRVNSKTGEVIPASRNVTNDPGYTADVPFYKKPAGIAAIAFGGAALGFGIYKLSTN